MSRRKKTDLSIAPGSPEGVEVGGDALPGREKSAIQPVRLKDFIGKDPASARQVVEWVFNNLDVEGLKPKDAPSPGAWSLLQRVRLYPELTVDFYKTVWPKLLPNKAQIEAEDRARGGGTDELERSLERVEQALGAAESAPEYQF